MPTADRKEPIVKQVVWHLLANVLPFPFNVAMLVISLLGEGLAWLAFRLEDGIHDWREGIRRRLTRDR